MKIAFSTRKRHILRKSHPKQPPKRKPRGYYTRTYDGGPFDGRTEQVPIFPKAPIMSIWKRKELWQGTRLELAYEYMLVGEAKKPKPGDACTYTFMSIVQY